eukprot:CAMPEP_0167781030 /NCGR_PEP_ID=MMETSP0111_2-20121227/5698_1 /TAXON_ID=91324 /ORGANISM="Lotharella globosa, Strain CCCM811" /LENGTH=438 /DNA_ID=CAMNT_0007671631 /DNA_START=72 /DNA_END=1388 /DNA_ORIENTATION=+
MPIDWETKLSASARRRPTNALKELCAPLLHKKGMVLLGGGLPSAQAFPFTKISAEFTDGVKVSLSEGKGLLSALQYNAGGVAPLREWASKLIAAKVKPLCEDWEVTLTAGSSDAIEKMFGLLVDEGDVVFTEDHTYSAALSNIRGYGGVAWGVAADHEGVLPAAFEEEIERAKKQGKTIKALYVVPIGANPSGAVMSPGRCKELYDIAKKHNLIVLEDCAYDWLQYTPDRKSKDVPGLRFGGFLPYDSDSRVIRLDTVSKFIAPGLRTGWLTGPKPFVRHFSKLSNLSTHCGSAISQSMVLSLLQQWGEEGLQAHIEKLQRMYQTRRNIVADAFDQHLKGLADWRVPDAGMFFWLRPKSLEAEKKDSRSLIPILLKHNVLVVPGGIFKAEGSDAPSPWLRLAFSYATDDDLKKGVEKLALVLKESAVASEEKEKASSS